MEKKFDSSGISGALGIFEKAIKTISYFKSYDEKLNKDPE